MRALHERSIIVASVGALVASLVSAPMVALGASCSVQAAATTLGDDVWIHGVATCAGGVRGIRLSGNDQMESMDVVAPEAQLLIVTRNGYGKRTPLSAYPTKGRGIGGVRAIRTTG